MSRNANKLGPRRLMKNLSRRQRQATPEPFARYLLNRLRLEFNTDVIACLWVARKSIYKSFLATDCWDQDRDANTYRGRQPIVAHPPCGCWGKYKAICKHDRSHGIRAMELVHQWGGVVEQPVGSELFYLHGRYPLWETVVQRDFGHVSLKPTWLYWIWPSMVEGKTRRRKKR